MVFKENNVMTVAEGKFWLYRTFNDIKACRGRESSVCRAACRAAYSNLCVA